MAYFFKRSTVTKEKDRVTEENHVTAIKESGKKALQSLEEKCETVITAPRRRYSAPQ